MTNEITLTGMEHEIYEEEGKRLWNGRTTLFVKQIARADDGVLGTLVFEHESRPPDHPSKFISWWSDGPRCGVQAFSTREDALAHHSYELLTRVKQIIEDREIAPYVDVDVPVRCTARVFQDGTVQHVRLMTPGGPNDYHLVEDLPHGWKLDIVKDAVNNVWPALDGLPSTVDWEG